MKELGGYKLSDFESDDFKLPQYLGLIDLLNWYYKEQEKAMKKK